MRVGSANGRLGEEHWTEAPARASNLSELELTLGDVGAAIRDGEGAVAYADRSGEAFHQMIRAARPMPTPCIRRVSRAEAEARFVEAEAMQAEQDPQVPAALFASVAFAYCDLLLADAERAAWRRLLVWPEHQRIPN